MGVKDVIYNAARDGQLNKLKSIMLQKSEIEFFELISTCRINGDTPLMIACQNGHLKVVEFLIQECHVDVDAVGIATFQDKKFDKVSPLWCATAAGHLNIVKKLLEQKASVNNAASTKYTPLCAASFQGHFETVKYLIENGADIHVSSKGGHTPLMIACFRGHYEISKYLVQCGAKVNAVSPDGYTALMIAIHACNLELAKYLIEAGANIEIADPYGQTCLIAACYKGYHVISRYLLDCGAEINRKTDGGNTALHGVVESKSLRMVEILFRKGAIMNTNFAGFTPLLAAALHGFESIVNFFINNYKLTKEEKITALELLGAVFVNKIENAEVLGPVMVSEEEVKDKALIYWKKAIELRFEVNECPLEKVNNSPLASYLGTTEVCTIDQLQNLNTADINEIKKQALLVKDRILGAGHPDVIRSLRAMGASYAFNGDLQGCFQMWMYALDVQQIVQEPLSPTTISILKLFTEFFSFMVNDRFHVYHGRLIVLTFKDVLCVFHKAVIELERAVEKFKMEQLLDSKEFSNTLILVLYLLGLMCMLQPNEAEALELKRSVYDFVQLNLFLKHGFTLLHLACLKEHPTYSSNYPVVSFPSLDIVELLLEVGACPNAMNGDRNTPLHLALMNSPCPVDILNLFVHHGAHLDNRNRNDQTPFQLICEEFSGYINPLKYFNLQCLCAQAISKYKIPYEGIVSNEMYEFLFSHCRH